MWDFKSRCEVCQPGFTKSEDDFDCSWIIIFIPAFLAQINSPWILLMENIKMI